MPDIPRPAAAPPPPPGTVTAITSSGQDNMHFELCLLQWTSQITVNIYDSHSTGS